MERALLALCGLLLNFAFAGPRPWYLAIALSPPAQAPARFLRDLERKLNREHRSPKEREMRGILLVVLAVIVSLVLGSFAQWLLEKNLAFIELLIVAAALPLRPTVDLANLIARQLQAGNVAGARQAFEGTPWRHHALLDEHGAARAAIETVAVNFSEKIVSPVFWYLVFGLPGVFVSKSLTFMQQILARPGEASDFSKGMLWANDAWHYIPSRLAALLWMAASIFLPAADMHGVTAKIRNHLVNAPSQKLSLLSAALVLKLSLGGPTSIYSNNAWVEGGTAKALPGDIKRVLYLFALLNLLLFILLGFFLFF